MKKLSLGSFPLTEIRAEDRKCLDRYLIKTFSDNISISDAVRNLAITKNLMYITPDSLMQYWLKIKGHGNEVAMERTSNSLYDQALKRAFFVLKEFYKKIKSAPFYKEYIYYPIYVEKIERINAAGNVKSDSQYTEVLYNYSFVILSNDLTKGLKIDEIRYDENASLNFLFIFIEFFSSDEFGGSIHDFNQKDYDFLVKLYQFIEQSGKDPIHMVIDLYKLLALIKDAVNGQTKSSLGFQRGIEKIGNEKFKKYSGMLKHKLVEIVRKNTNGPSEKKAYREAFISIMSAIFKSEGLNGLYDGVEKEASYGERLQYVYSINKYREILNLAKELIEYNKLDCKDVLTRDPMDFDFSVESGNVSIDTQRHILSQKYQTFFKTYVESISNYLESVIDTLIRGLDLDKEVETEAKTEAAKAAAEISTLEGRIKLLQRRLAKARIDFNDAIADEQAASAAGNSAAQKLAVDKMEALNKLIASYQNDIDKLQNEINQRKTLANLMSSFQKDINLAINSAGQDVIKKIKDSLLSSIANDLTFIYDDGKTFFKDDLIAEGFLKLIADSSTDITTPKGFEHVASQADTYPEKLRTKEGYEEPNPDYYAAQIVKGLNTTFDIMADDTITALQDSFRPAIQEILLRKNKGSKQYEKYAIELLDKLFANTDESGFFKKLPMNFRDKLANEIYQNRFLAHVLNNFKNYFRMYKVTKRIDYDEDISQLHPLIQRLIKKGRRCQYFKSFIISYDMCEQLYRTKYLVDTEKFLAGLLRQPPRQLNNPMNKLQEVLYNYLGLKENPVWVISRQNVYLSMPDDLSLTHTSILSKIPKKDLMEVCRIREADYWNQQTMGKVAQIGNKKIAQKIREKKKVEEDIKSEKNKLRNAKSNEKKRINERLDKLYRRRDKIDEEIAKLKLEEKTYRPNAFLFDDFDNPNRAEENPLLTDAERQDLEQSKEKMRENLLNLNPYSDEEYKRLEHQAEKIRESHPFEFEEEPEPQKEEPQESELEKFLRMREEMERKGNNGNKF